MEKQLSLEKRMTDSQIIKKNDREALSFLPRKSRHAALTSVTVARKTIVSVRLCSEHSVYCK
ncbi:MAG: hypothetical protein Q8909_16525 [Bacteroidota bacterium]|nr:hypothetical protein [Bacteroidota bacterium]